MNILFINHYFDQDIDAMRKKAGTHTIRVLHFSSFRKQALRILPKPIMEDHKGAWDDPLYSRERQLWKKKSRQIIYDYYKIFPFDVVIAPSDTFYYLRDVIKAVQDLGIPYIILQKETTISPYTMVEHAAEIGRTFPFISDLMLVCSERHKQFWLNTGANGDNIIVTGQPRFDYYLEPEQSLSWNDLGIPIQTETKTILFLSYDVGAYSPEGERTSSLWQEMRSQTESTLLKLASEGYVVLLKPHPQQKNYGEQERLQNFSGTLWNKNFFFLDGELDVRHLIINADIIVGFQTTALFEAMIARKNVIYTFWAGKANTYADLLIPFHEVPHLLRCVHSPEELVKAVYEFQGSTNDEAIQKQRTSFFSEYLGPFDGKATQRAWHYIETYTIQNNVPSSLRTSLNEQAPAFCRLQYYRFSLYVLFWSLVQKGLILWYPIWKQLRPYIKKQLVTPSRAHYLQLLSNWIEYYSQQTQDCSTILERNKPHL